LHFFLIKTDFYQELNEVCFLLRYYVAYIGNSLPKFRDKLSSWISLPLKMGQIGCTETSVKNYNYSLCNNPEKCRSHLFRGGNLKSRTELTVAQNWSSPHVI